MINNIHFPGRDVPFVLDVRRVIGQILIFHPYFIPVVIFVSIPFWTKIEVRHVGYLALTALFGILWSRWLFGSL
jgi:hypothetical protein